MSRESENETCLEIVELFCPNFERSFLMNRLTNRLDFLYGNIIWLKIKFIEQTEWIPGQSIPSECECFQYVYLGETNLGGKEGRTPVSRYPTFALTCRKKVKIDNNLNKFFKHLR